MPDVRAAERNLAAATAQIGVAKAALPAIITATRNGRGLTPSASASATAIGVINTATVALDRSSVKNRVAP